MKGEEPSVKDKDLSALFRTYVPLPSILTINMHQCELIRSHFWPRKMKKKQLPELECSLWWWVVSKTDAGFCGPICLLQTSLCAIRCDAFVSSF